MIASTQKGIYVAKNKNLSSHSDKYFQKKKNEWLSITRSDTVDTTAMAEWMVANKEYQRPQKTLIQLCAAEISKALAHEMHVDEQGRTVRSNYSYRVEADGQRAWEWSTAELITPGNMRKAMTHRRNGLVSRAIQHATDVNSYNDNNKYGAQLELYDYNLNSDVMEADLPEEYPDEDPDA